MRIVSISTTLLIGLFASHAFAADVCSNSLNLVQNCGFETGDLTDWTVSGTDSAPANNGNGIYYGVENYNQFSGNYAAYFGAVGGDIALSQTLNNLIYSDVYTVTVEVFNDTTPDTSYLNNFSITLGNITSYLETQVPAGNYSVYSLVAGANSTSPTLSISSRNDAGYWNIDSIQVQFTSTPEPSALALSGTAFGALAVYLLGVRRRRRSIL